MVPDVFRNQAEELQHLPRENDGRGVEDDLLRAVCRGMRLGQIVGEAGHEQPQAPVLEELESDDVLVAPAALGDVGAAGSETCGAASHSPGASVSLMRVTQIGTEPPLVECHPQVLGLLDPLD